MQNKICCIYYYLNKNNNQYYIGQTVDLIKRDQDHYKKSSKGYFDNAYSKHKNNFELEYTECDECLLDFLEQYYIIWFQSKKPNGYNLTDGGEGGRGYQWTDEQKEHQRQMALNKPKPSEETKQKIRQSMLGKNNDKKNPMYGKSGIDAPNSKKVLCIETNKIYYGVPEASKNTGIGQSNIYSAIRSGGTAGKLHWMYAE